MKTLVGSLVLVLVFAITATAEDVVFKKTALILKEPIKALELKKGDELPVRVVMGDSVLLIMSEHKAYNYDVMKWVKQRDTTAVHYVNIQDLRYERSARTRGLEAVLISPLFLLGGKEKFHWLYIRHTPVASEKPESLILRLEKNEQRDFRRELEDRSGKKIEVVIEDVK